MKSSSDEVEYLPSNYCEITAVFIFLGCLLSKQRIILSVMSENLCTKCKKFFGNPQNMNMCSVCFKSQQKTEKIISEIKEFKVPQIPQQAPAKQTDHSRCFACKKKVGLLGYLCKGCECSYCNNHRLPEDHKCEGNYIQMAKDSLKKNNPNISAPKIEKF